MMKKVILILVTMSFLAGLLPSAAATAQELAPATEEPDFGAVVCAPGLYPVEPDGCLPLGPSALIGRMAQSGIPVPQRPLPARRSNLENGYVPYQYFRVDSKGAPLYSSLEAAMNDQQNGRYLEPGFVFVSYLGRVENEKGVYYRLGSGEWIVGNGSRIAPPKFQGLEFSATPRNAFGWVLSEADTRRAANYLFSNPVVQKLYRFNIIQIYATEVTDNTKWYLIGPDEWIEARLVAAVFPNTTPPDGVANGRWIEVNLEQQTIAVYDNRRLAYATVVSSGVDPFWTQPGLFQIYKKKEIETMSGAFEADRSDYYYLEDVPWTMYYDQARALHGAYWHTLFGYTRSHGCVNLSIGDAKWLFEWADEGDWVWVHDPSGVTPTDPAYYGAGGA